MNGSISVSMQMLDRENSVAIFRVLDNNKSVHIRIDFASETVEKIGWDQVGNGYTEMLPETDADTEPSVPHTSQWELAGQWLGALTSPHKMRLFAKASISKFIEGPVSLPVLDHRHQCCHGVNLAGEKVSEPCTAKYATDSGVFCKTCGCPEYSMADISVNHHKPPKSKLAFPALECPMNKFSTVSGRRREARNAY